MCNNTTFMAAFLTWLVFAIATIAIAVKEGWYDRWKVQPNPKKRKPSAFIWHVYSALIYGMGLTIMVYFWKYNSIDLRWWQTMISILFMRYALFDWSRNIAQGLPIEYVGSTDWYSLLIKKVPVFVRICSRLLILILAYGFLII